MSHFQTSFETFDIQSHWVLDEEKRLNASFYAKDAMATMVLLDKLNENEVEISTINDLSKKVYWPGRFKRKYVSKKIGDPFLTPSEIFMFSVSPRKFVIDYPDDLSIKKNWLLVTRSGSIGRCLISTELLEDFVLSDDLIRIIPDNFDKLGYIYAYLKTWMGQALLTKDKYGMTVKHIEPQHIENIPIPRLGKFEDEINRKILEAHELRQEAQENLLKAENILSRDLNLIKFDEDDVNYFGGNEGKIVKSFSVSSNKLGGRLDASYHIPLAHIAVSHLNHLEKEKMGKIKRMDEITDSFVPPRFRRPYVDQEEGIPLLQGTHIVQIKPLDLKFIWKKMKTLKKYVLKKNWILVTCSGTIGRLSLVSRLWDGWAATNHLLRIIPKNEINPGYLTCFLLSFYGQIQFQRLVYGGVVDEIGEAGELINDIKILKPNNKKLEDEIGKLMTEAYEKRDAANDIENKIISKLEKMILNYNNI